MGGDNFKKSPKKIDVLGQPPRSVIHQNGLVGKTLRKIIHAAQTNVLSLMDTMIQSWFLNYVVPAVTTAALKHESSCSVPIPEDFYVRKPQVNLAPFNYQFFLERYVARIKDEDVNVVLADWPPPIFTGDQCCTNPQYGGGIRNACLLCNQIYRNPNMEPGRIIISW